MVRRIAHICIGAKDLKSSAEFYSRILGLERKFSFMRDGREIGCYFSAGEGGFIEIFEQNECEEKNPLIRHFCLEVENLDLAVAHIRECGVETSEKTRGCDGTWQAWVKDPCGVSIELFEYTESSAQMTGADCTADW